MFLFSENSNAGSPSFSRQQIIDYPLDWYKMDSNGEFTISASKLRTDLHNIFRIENVSELSAVSFSSDGKILNSTIWLSGPFNPSPKTSNPQYYIRFDTDSNLYTGDKDGAEYVLWIYWNKDTQKWIKILQEFSNTKNIRIVHMDTNYTDFFSKLDSSLINNERKYSDWLNCCYLSIPIDLKNMNYPKSYSMSFHVLDKINISSARIENIIDMASNLTEIIKSNKTNNLTEIIKSKFQNFSNFNMDKNTKQRIMKILSNTQFLDSTGDISVPSPFYQIAPEFQKINLTQNQKSVNIVIQSYYDYPANISLSIDKKRFSTKIYFNRAFKTKNITSWKSNI